MATNRNRDTVPLWLYILALVGLVLMSVKINMMHAQIDELSQPCQSIERFEDGSIVDPCSGFEFDPDTGQWAPIP